ncbi:MAG: Ig-like domain-containing protein [Planctomycetota bacterium]
MPNSARVSSTLAAPRASTLRARPLLTLFAAACAALAGCSGSSSPSQSTGGGAAFGGSSGFFFEDPHFGGAASEVRIESVSYGRLVELTARDASGQRVRMAAEYVIGGAVVTQAGDWELTTNPVTGQQTLFVDRNVDDPDGRADFLSFAEALGNQLTPVLVREPDAALVSMVPRNAALVVQFDDLLDPASIHDRTIELLLGDPPADTSAPFRPSIPHEARIFPAQQFGGRSSSGARFPTRVVVDLTISEVEASASTDVLAVNTLGMRPSTRSGRANAVLRFGTRVNSTIGVTNVVRNLAGSTLATTGNGPVDAVSSTEPVIRPFRSGGAITGLDDPYNGFLPDEEPPVVVGTTQVELLDPPLQLAGVPGGRRFVLPRVRFASTRCGTAPAVGDVVVQAGVFAQVVADGADLDMDGLVRDVQVRLVSFPDAWNGPGVWETTGLGNAAYETAFDPSADVTRTECFARVLPLPTGFPEAPGMGVSPESTFTLRFSEPMAPSSLTAFDSVTLTREPVDGDGALPSSSYVVGSLGQSQDLRSVTYVPRVSLSHQEGQTEPYYLGIADADSGAQTPEDLAGNPVATIPPMRFTIERSAGTRLNGGRVSRFTSIDEEAPEGPEWGGQILLDSVGQILRPRPVLRGTAVLDNNQPMLALQRFIAGGVVTPHSPFGSRLQTLWRYCDCGFSLTDIQDQSLDIEGLSWRPSGATVTNDRFERFEIRLAHCQRLPDEFINSVTAWPLFPNSGLRAQFSRNLLQSERDDVPGEVVVHPRERGYTIDVGDLYVASSGSTMIPFPLNRDGSFDDNRWFTWRDPRVRARATESQLNGGTEPYQWFVARGLPAPPWPLTSANAYRPYYGETECQTIGLPLLMEFRVFPDLGAVGQNAWDFNIAANSSARPYFRAFSTGGNDTSGATILIQPDTNDAAAGGFDPTTSPPGERTFGRDNNLQHGAIDYVTRISHAHSIWFEAPIAGESGFVGRRYSEPILEPSAAELPTGTEVRVEYRGATSIAYLNDERDWALAVPSDPCPPDPLEGGLDNDGDAQNTDPTLGLPDFRVNAFLLDLYGDYYNDRDRFSRTFGSAPEEEEPRPCTDPNDPPIPRVPTGVLQHGPDRANPGISFLAGSDAWRTEVQGIRDARYYQVRLTFVGNPETGATAEVSAFALTWTP